MLVHENFCTFCVDSQFHILIWMMAVCMPSTDNLASVLRLLFRWMLRYFRHQTVRLQCNVLWCPIVHTSVILVIGYTCMILCFDFFFIMIFSSNGRGTRCIYCILWIFSVLLLGLFHKHLFAKSLLSFGVGKKNNWKYNVA